MTPHIALRALKERLSHHPVAVVARSVAESDDVHDRSTALCEWWATRELMARQSGARKREGLTMCSPGPRTPEP